MARPRRSDETRLRLLDEGVAAFLAHGYHGAGLAEVLARHPRLKAIVAHMGTPEYDDFLALAHRYPNVGLDTTMAFTDFVERMSPYPRELLPQLTDLGLAGKLYFGSDFPNIPDEYSHQLDSLERLGLGDDWLRAVLWGNASALFDQPGA